jgi:hypothetical protein
MEDHLRVGETTKTATVTDVVFDRLPQKHLRLGQPLRVGVHHVGHLRGTLKIMFWMRLKCLNAVNARVELCKAITNGAWKPGASTVWMSLSKQRSMMTAMIEQWNAKNRSEGLRAASALRSLLT